MKYIELSFNEAMDRKHRDGVKKYRPNGGPFVGDVLEELFQELLDAYAYCGEAIKQEYELEHRLNTIRAMALELQTMHRQRRKDGDICELPSSY